LQEAWFRAQLATAAAESHADFGALECVALRGRDHDGHRILAITGTALPPLDAPADAARFARYVYTHVAQLVEDAAPFVILYYHTNVTEAGRPRVAWLWNAFDALPERVQERLAAVYVVHPVATFRGALALLPFVLCAPFAGGGVAHKTRYLDSLAELWRHAAREEVNPPRAVAEADDALAAERAAPVPRSQVKAERLAATEN